MNDEFYASLKDGELGLSEEVKLLLRRIDPDQRCPHCRGIGELFSIGITPLGGQDIVWENCYWCMGTGIRSPLERR